MDGQNKLIRFMNCWILRDHKIVKEDLWIRNGKIANPEEIFFVEKSLADATIDCDNSLIAPGFIDIQINGGWGVDFSYDTDNVKNGVELVARHLLKYGITSFCPTMVTSDSTTYHKVLPQIKKQDGGKNGANILGVHLEGPFINAIKKGAHTDHLIRAPEKGMESIKEMYGTIDNVAIVTLAPELKGSCEAIKCLSEKGIKIALGHSAADLAESEEGVKCGANLITHLFNAMLPFHHRDPGLVGLLASPKASHIHYGIIADGIHTHPAALRIAYKTNKNGLILVSDAVPALGLPDGNHHIGPQSVRVLDGRAYIVESGVLCGSTATLDKCVRIFKDATGCSTEYALEAASLHPARALNICDRKGTLNFGSDADFIIMNRDTLQVHSTWIAGECVWKNTLISA